jgi:flagellin
MTSILTNTASMIALQTLNSTQSALRSTESQISTGLAVNTAADNASTWAVATNMRKDISNLMQTSTNLGSAENLVGAALAGATTVASLITSIQGKVTAEASGTENSTDVQNDITALVNQIQNVVDSSSYSGVNILGGPNTNSASMTFASSVVSNSAGLSQVSSITVAAFANATGTGGGTAGSDVSTAGNLNTTGTGGLSALVNEFGAGTSSTYAAVNGGVTASTLQSALQDLDAMANDVNSVAASLGSSAQSIGAQQTFVNNLVNTLQTGVSGLVDADMTEESARLSALQTQQQLGTQALSIANQAPQMILKLFG